MTPIFVPADATLAAPQRNRFFYGKLMDVAHFQEEQAYFRRQQALINRLALGSGVLAGLNLVAGATTGSVTIQPGAAIDGAGRLIVVPQAFNLDAHQATDGTGAPLGGAPLTAGSVVISSLAYAAEGTAQSPVAVLVPSCDAPTDCAPSTIVEGFVALVRAEATPPTPNYGCQLGKTAPPPDPALLKLLTTNVSAAFPGPCPRTSRCQSWAASTSPMARSTRSPNATSSSAIRCSGRWRSAWRNRWARCRARFCATFRATTRPLRSTRRCPIR